jgi:hypothetical protein
VAEVAAELPERDNAADDPEAPLGSALVTFLTRLSPLLSVPLAYILAWLELVALPER